MAATGVVMVSMLCSCCKDFVRHFLGISLVLQFTHLQLQLLHSAVASGECDLKGLGRSFVAVCRQSQTMNFLVSSNELIPESLGFRICHISRLHLSASCGAGSLTRTCRRWSIHGTGSEVLRAGVVPRKQVWAAINLIS